MRMTTDNGEESKIVELAKDLVAIEKPLPEKADMKAVVELLGRIEHELIVHRRERLVKTYLIVIAFLLPLLGLGFLIPEFLKSVKIQ